MNSQQPEPIRQDYLNGMSFKDIARKYYIDQRTAKRYAINNLPLSELDHRTYPSILDPYEPIIRGMLEKQPIFARTIYKVLREHGYSGSYSLVNRRVQQIIQENASAGLYPAGQSRSKKISERQVSIMQKMTEEDEHAAYRI